jgi:hypothetical protein
VGAQGIGQADQRAVDRVGVEIQAVGRLQQQERLGGLGLCRLLLTLLQEIHRPPV